MAITRGSVTVDHNGVGTVALETTADVVLLSSRELDDAIEALCAMRQSLDPGSYAEFAAKLYPWNEVLKSPKYGDVVRTIRDLTSEPHGGTVTADGRTSAVVVDD